MPHNTALIATVAAALGAAFLLGLIAVRVGFPPIVGYLVAGIAVGPVVLPGALLQSTITAVVGTLIGRAFGWGWGGGVVLGLSLCVASTVVLLKGLEGRDRLDSPEGRLAIGWLVVEDITMVVALVLLPAVAPMLSGAATAGG